MHACSVTGNASYESTNSSKRLILTDTFAIEKDQNMNAGSSAMPVPLEPPAQPECCQTPFVTPFDSSDGMLKLNVLAVVAENKALNEERENLPQKYSDTQHQFLQLQKLQEGCFGCHKLKEKDYKYYNRFTKEQFDAVYIFFVPTDEDPIKWSRTVKGSKFLSTTDQL